MNPVSRKLSVCSIDEFVSSFDCYTFRLAAMRTVDITCEFHWTWFQNGIGSAPLAYRSISFSFNTSLISVLTLMWFLCLRTHKAICASNWFLLSAGSGWPQCRQQLVGWRVRGWASASAPIRPCRRRTHRSVPAVRTGRRRRAGSTARRRLRRRAPGVRRRRAAAAASPTTCSNCPNGAELKTFSDRRHRFRFQEICSKCSCSVALERVPHLGMSLGRRRISLWNECEACRQSLPQIRATTPKMKESVVENFFGSLISLFVCFFLPWQLRHLMRCETICIATHGEDLQGWKINRLYIKKEQKKHDYFI